LTQHVRALESRPNLDDVPRMLGKAHRELMSALGGLRATRQTIQDQAISRLRDTTSKLSEVTTATEDAATSMLDSLDRASAATEALAADADQPLSGSQQESIDTLRTEIANLFNSLQFQDITAQQISGASERLRDVESRLEVVAGMFATHQTAHASEADLAYNPDATLRDAAARQRVADSVIEAANDPGATHDVTVPDA
jgi:chemotaxis regulatin CheY-phosphate phosphatase CheZ